MDDSTAGKLVDAADGFEIRSLIGLVRERWRLIVICLAASVLGALFLGIGYLEVTPRVYEATVIVEVPRHAPRAVNLEMTTEDEDLRGDEILKTIEQNLQRISLFQSVMEREAIVESEALQQWLDGPVDAFEPGELAQLLGEWTRVRHQRGTRLISITVEHSDAGLAKNLANAIVEEFALERNDVRSGTSDSALDFLLTEVERVRAELQDSEDELMKLQEFEDALALEKKIEEQEDHILQLTQRYRDKHPTLIQARSRLAAQRELLRAELLPAHRLTGEEIAVKHPKFMTTASGIDRDEQLEATLQQLETRFNVLSLEVETNRALYETLVARLSEANVTSQWDAAPFQIVEPAFVAMDSAKPRGVRVMGVSVVLGSGLGMGLVWILLAVDNSLRTVSEAERSVGLPALGAIPDAGRLPGLKGVVEERRRRIEELIVAFEKGESARGGIDPLVMLSDHSGPVSEAIRTLRAALTCNGHRTGRRTILITSALPGEGKTFVAANLAVAFAAEEHEKVLLIDGNLRRPMIGKFFGAAPPRNGIDEVLAGNGGLETCVIASGIRRLDLLLVEKTFSKSAELFSGEGVARLLGSLSEKYHRVIIDGPQVNSVSDALLFASHVDAAVLVARAARTPRDAVFRARDLLKVVECKPAGLVINGLPR